MADDPQGPQILTSAPTEIEAAAIVSALSAHGVQAATTGGYTAGFRAEAPGDVKVVVRREDLQRAQQALAQIQGDQTDVDWSQVDVGEPDDS